MLLSYGDKDKHTDWGEACTFTRHVPRQDKGEEAGRRGRGKSVDSSTAC